MPTPATPAAIQVSVEPAPGRLRLRARLIAGVARAQLGPGTTIVPVPADLLHTRGPDLVASGLPRLIDHLRNLSDCQLLPGCLERHGAGLITLIELGDRKELTSEGFEALRVIIDELNALPAQ